MNSISITGRLAADSEMRYTTTNDAILNFRVADDVGYGDKKATNWWACSLFGKRAESLQQYLMKGQQVTVIGGVTMREWTNKEGIKQLSPDVRVTELALVGGKSDQDQSKPTTRPNAAKQQGNSIGGGMENPDDIPF